MFGLLFIKIRIYIWINNLILYINYKYLILNYIKYHSLDKGKGKHNGGGKFGGGPPPPLFPSSSSSSSSSPLHDLELWI